MISLNRICTIKLMILLKIKCQPSKPEVTVARNQNAIGDTNGEKSLRRNQAQKGGQFSSGQLAKIQKRFYVWFTRHWYVEFLNILKTFHTLMFDKTKELIVDFRKRQQRHYTPLMIHGTPVERVSSFKYLGVNISENLTWTAHIQTQVKKARQRLYHLRQLRKYRVSPAILKTFYSGTIDSILTRVTGRTRRETCRSICKALLGGMVGNEHGSHIGKQVCIWQDKEILGQVWVDEQYPTGLGKG